MSSKAAAQSSDISLPETGQFRFPAWSGFLWGFAEATVFFIVPDVLITLACLLSVKQGLKQLGAVLAGSLAGGILMYLAAIGHPSQMIRLVEAVPFVRPEMLGTVRADLAAHGAWALCLGPLSGIPYKIYAVLAPARISLIPFVSVSVPARLERLLASFVLFAVIGLLFRKFWPGRRSTALAVHLIYWLVVYGFYWNKI